MDLAPMDESISYHSSCSVGHRIYVVGGSLGAYASRPNPFLFSLDMHSPRQWEKMKLFGLGGRRLNPVICQIGPDSLMVSGGKAD